MTSAGRPLTWKDNAVNETSDFVEHWGVITRPVRVTRWYELDLTSYRKAERTAGRNTVTLLIAGTAETTSAVASFASRESGANGPQLVIVP